MTKDSDISTLKALKNISEHHCVTVTGKIASVSPVEKITVKSTEKNLIKKDFVLADCTSVTRCVVWEGHVKEVREGPCYRFTNVTIRSFYGGRYLSECMSW